MKTTQCYEDLKKIFSTPGEFSTPLVEGESYIFMDNGVDFFVVSKRWGYWISVIDTLQRYFAENGPLDDGAGLQPSNNDLLGTSIRILSSDFLKGKREE